MLCNEARRRLELFDWNKVEYSRDSELLSHLESCERCATQVLAETELVDDFEKIRKMEPSGDMHLSILQEAVRSAKSRNATAKPGFLSRYLPDFVFLGATTWRKAAFATLAVGFLLLLIIPFNFREKVGYQIAIGGVEKNIAVSSQEMSSLLDALGMEESQAATLLDSLGASNVNFSVGECTETCRLTISDLKTERDVRLMVKAIIDLGCCQIDNIAPMFRDESNSLLGFAFKKLLS